MIFGIDRNKTNLMLTIIVMSAAVISCTMLREIGNRPPERTRQFNESVPAGLENAEEDHRVHDPSSFIVLLPAPGRILLRDPESQPIDLSTLGRNVKEFAATKTPDTWVVYLAASVDIPLNDVSTVLDELRNQDIDNVKLLASRHKPSDNEGWFPKSIREPDRVLEVKLINQLAATDRPNPLTLLIRMGPDGKPLLNNEVHADAWDLAEKLSEIFKEREFNGVFREGTNEVEKTVLIKTNVSNRKYGEIVKIVDAVKGSGASPIVLANEETLLRSPPRQERVRIPLPTKPGQKEPPDIISGGVLNGKATSLPKPPYPAAARAVNATGAVTVQITIDIDGKVISANAVSGHPLLRPAAVAAARSAQFAPTLLSGKPVKVSGVLAYNFVP